MLGIQEKKKKEVDLNAPPVPLTREQQEMVDMDKYYTTFNWELPDQKPMVLPPKPKREKKNTTNSKDPKSGKEDTAGPSAYTSPDPVSLASVDPVREVMYSPDQNSSVKENNQAPH